MECAAAPNPVDVAEYVKLVKAIDLAGATAFLDARPSFDCDVVDPGFRHEESHACTAVWWLTCEIVRRDPDFRETDSPAIRLLRLVVARGGRLDHRTGAFGITPAHLCLPVLFELGASVSIRNSLGLAPLHIACYLPSHRPRIRSALRAGASVSLQTFSGDTPLHILVSRRSACEESVGMLLDAGASLVATNARGETPLHLIFGCAEQSKERMKPIQDLVCARIGRMMDAGSDLLAHINASTPSDLALQLPERRLSVHRLVMSARSEKLRALCHSGMKEAADGVLNVGGTGSAEPFDTLVQYLYGKAWPSGTFEETAALARLADEYLVPTLSLRCEERLCQLLCKENALDAVMLASSINLKSLLARARHLIADNFVEFTLTPAFIEAISLPSFAPLQQDIMRAYQAIENRKKRKRLSEGAPD